MKLHWILFAMIALFSFSILITLITFSARKGTPISFILFGIFLVGTISYGIQTAVTTQFSFEMSTSTILLVIAMGILSVIGNYGQFEATTAAPNPGLAIAVVSLQSGLIAILATIFFKDKLNFLQIAGIVVGIIGVAMISFGSSGKKKIQSIPEAAIRTEGKLNL